MFPSTSRRHRGAFTLPSLLATALVATATGNPAATAAPRSTAAPVVTAAPVATPAPEATPAPDDGVLVFSGHAFGHGRGMSQWGAYGAATKGLSWTQILDFYYPGAARSVLSDSEMRVWISGDNDGSTTVLAVPGLAVTTQGPATASSVRAGGRAGAADTATSTVLPATLPDGTAVTQWRVSRGADGQLVLAARSVSGWAPFALPAGVTLTVGSAAFTAPSVVTLVLPSGSLQELRGAVRAILSGTTVRTVLVTTMETYLRGVVPNEMPSSWHAQALAAQTVAARTYAAAYRQRQRVKGSFYDICDSTTCQVFSGVATVSVDGRRVPREQASTDAAIAATAGVVLRTSGAPGAPLAYTEFSASNGGWITSGGVPYLPAKADPYDGVVPNSSHSWTVRVPAARIASVYGLGRFLRVEVLARAGGGEFGGRVTSARLVGTSRTVVVTGAQVAAAFGMKSGWWAVTSRTDLVRDLSGDGRADVALLAGGRLLTAPGTGVALSPLAPFAAAPGLWKDKDAVIAAGQWDQAGGQDLISRVRGTGALILHPGTTPGSFGAGKVILASGAQRYRSLTGAGDLDGDGHADLIGIDARTGALTMLGGRQGGALAAPVTLASRWTGISTVIAPGDITGDGVPDLIGVTAKGVLVRYSGAGRVVAGRLPAATPQQIGTGWGGYAAVWSPGDLSGDGVPDLLGLTRRGVLYVATGTGTGGFRGLTAVRTRLAGVIPAR